MVLYRLIFIHVSSKPYFSVFSPLTYVLFFFLRLLSKPSSSVGVQNHCYPMCAFRGKEGGTSKVVFVGYGDPLPYSLCLTVLAGSILLRYSSLLHTVPFCRWMLPACGYLQKQPFLSSFVAY